MNLNNIPLIDNIQNTVQKVKNGELKVLDLIKEHINRSVEINKYTNSLITVLDSSAIEEAKKIDDLISKKDPQILNKKLIGIPFTVKDLYLVEGTKTTFASQYMKDFVAPYTATVVQKCLNEGAILIGKCNSDPWGYGGSGENSGYGPTRHPLDLEKTPGGSSSGSAASLLAGVGFFSLGTDTGGSVRLPASFCGLYGLKPTYGRNSRYGIGAMGSSFDTPGFFARYIEDIKLLEEVMEGKDDNDSTTFDLSLIKQSNKSFDELKIALPEEFFIEGIDKEVKLSIETFISNISDKVKLVKTVSIPTIKYALSIYYILVPAEISSNQARYDGVRYGPKVSEIYEENLLNGRSKFFEREVKRRIMIGTYVLNSGYADQYYKKALLVREKLKQEFINVFNNFDIVIAPVSPTTAFRIGEKSQDPLQMYLVDIFTVVANLVGIPGISIPIGKDSNQMPVGLQAMSNYFQENLLYEFASKAKTLLK